MTSFVLKIFAIISMAFDHVGIALFSFSPLNYIGRLAFPIFAFQLTQGYIHTRNKKTYGIRLLVFAIISQIPFQLFLQKFSNTNTLTLNIFFTLLLGLICISLYQFIMDLKTPNEKKSNADIITEKQSLSVFNIYNLKKLVAVVIVLLIAYIGNVINVDYGLWGVLVIFSFYLFRNDKIAMIFSFITLCILKYGIWIIQYGLRTEYVCLALFTILAIIPICLYNGKKGHSLKYAFYIFYPVHLILLYLLV